MSIHAKLDENPTYKNSKELVGQTLRYLQLREAIGQAPSITVFGEEKFASCIRSRNKKARNEAWENFKHLIECTLQNFRE